MNYISNKSCSLLISGSGTRFVVYETIENAVITLYKSIRALQMFTMYFPKQIKWCLWQRQNLSLTLGMGGMEEEDGGEGCKNTQKEGQESKQGYKGDGMLRG